MKKIILCPNMLRDVDGTVTEYVAEAARRRGITIRKLPMFDDGLSDSIMNVADSAQRHEIIAALDEADLIIALGGDGTILRVARLAIDADTPILGINLGGKGFLAELDLATLTEELPNIFDGGFTREERLTLNVELVREGRVIAQDIAINDVVISGGGRVIDLMVYGDGHRISHFTGDGVIVATPTGSTAYSMAAGGPIVEPTAQNILVTPICAHVLEAKPYVLVSDRQVAIEIGSVKRNASYMTVDGNDRFDMRHGDILRINKSEKTALLAHIPDINFYKRVSEKLGDTL